MTAILQTDIPGMTLLSRGKVRDMYLVEDKLLIVATDRISAFDVVLPSAIPYKGAVLTALSVFWFDYLKELVPNHFISADVAGFPAPLPNFADKLEGRSMLVVRADVVPIECVARGYLSGSGWKEYKATGEVCGIKLPSGLKESDKLPEPIFTPATKEQTGHDINISEAEMANLVGGDLTSKLRDLTLA
ncbi:MAG TPA: phosphoribosylaminoimidazolesuccinocarboxamide synthase, partial [Blastocatellia bacterium]